MTEAQINCFLSVVREGSFSKAALAQYISQPAISKNVAKLEEELGFPLLERTSSSLHPTPAGRKLAIFWQNKHFEYKVLLNEIRSQLKDPTDTLRIGCPETWNPSCFLPVIEQVVKEQYPYIKYQLTSDRLPNLMSDLHEGRLDIVMTHEFHPQLHYGYASFPITSTGCGILFANEFFPGFTSLADLADSTLLVFDSDMEKQFIGQMRKAFDKVGLMPKIKNCGLYSTALFEMSCGHGIMVFTDWDITIKNSAFTYIPLSSQLAVNIIYSKSNSNGIIKDFGQALSQKYLSHTEG